MTEHDETTTRRRGLSRRPAMTLTLALALIAAGCGAPAGPGTGPADGTPETTGAETTTAPDNGPAQTAPPPADTAGPGTAASRPGGEPCDGYDWAERDARAALDKLDRWDDPQPPTRRDFQVANAQIGHAERDHEQHGCPPPGPAAVELVERLDLAAQETAADSEAEAEAVDAACADIPPAYLDDTCPGYTPPEDPAEAADPETGDNPGTGDNPEPAPPTAGPGDTPTGTLPPPEPPEPPDPPEGPIDFEDPERPVELNQPSSRQHPGPVTWPARRPVTDPSVTAHLCPDELPAPDGSPECADPDGGSDDFLRFLPGDFNGGKCVHGAIYLGVGDVVNEGVVGEGYVQESLVTILGFAAVEPGVNDAPWAFVRAATLEQIKVVASDGTVLYEDEHREQNGRSYWLVGGADKRGFNPDGSLAWGLFIFNPGEC